MTGICASFGFRQAELVAYHRQFSQDLHGIDERRITQNLASHTLGRYFWLPQSRPGISLLFEQSRTELELVPSVGSYANASENEAWICMCASGSYSRTAPAESVVLNLAKVFTYSSVLL